MARYFYIWIFIVVVAGVSVLFFYRTSSPVKPEAYNAEFGGISLRIEYATTSVARERGLSGRISIPVNYGMLFVFPKNDFYGFWMKDMSVPIDIFWLDDKGHVISIARDIATSTYPNVFYPTAPALYILETAAGFARFNAIATGTPLILKNPEHVLK